MKSKLFNLGGPGSRVLVRRDAHLTEDLRHGLGVDAAVVGHILLTAFVDVHRAHWTPHRTEH